MSDAVLVIGGGIAGIQAALDLAEAGVRVVLVEREAAIGGKMAALDKNFPTLDCSICIEAPKMREVVQHENIELLTLARVTRLEGEPGRFTAHIRQEPRFVTDECTRCDDCVPVCPVVRHNEFDAGMGARKAIFTPFSQAEPGPYAIELEACLNDPPHYLPCSRCQDACLPGCIDFTLLPRELTREVGAVIVATGFELMDARRMPEYGYGSHPDVLTSLEYERLLNSAGPSDGELVCPSDGRHPQRILFVLCVGSRDVRHRPYCSRVCCTYSTKQAVQAADHGVGQVTVLYLDMRTYGKGFEAFYGRARQEGVRYVRGRPAWVRPNGAGLRVRYEDTEAGQVLEEGFDMVVLAPALLPSTGSEELAQALELAVDEDGFIAALPEAGGWVATTRPGVYLAGCAGGPKDIPDSVAEAGAAAARALLHTDGRHWPGPVEAEPLDLSGPARVGVFVCDCGSNIAGTVRVPEVVEHARRLDGVGHAEEVMFACSGVALEGMIKTMRQKGLNRCVVAACSPRTHNATFQRACALAGVNPYLFEMANVRNHGSWVHKKEREAATKKARDLVKMAVAKARLLEPLDSITQPMTQRALVVGGGIAGMTGAANLARQGFEVHLVEREPRLGGLLGSLRSIAPERLMAQDVLVAAEREVGRAGVKLHLGTEVELISGVVGSYLARLSDGTSLEFGTVLLATGARPYQPAEFGYGSDERVMTNLELEERWKTLPAEQRITFVNCVGSRQGELGCSRYCCQSTIEQALALRRAGHRVRVLYKDIRTFGRHAEEAYHQAQAAGVQFVRYAQELTPQEALRWEDGQIVLTDELLGREIGVPTDVLVLVVGLAPEAKDGLAQMLKVSRSEDGFLLEQHPKLGPVQAAVEGVYLAGTAQGPKTVSESAAQALAASAKAAALLSHPTIEQEPLAAQLIAEKCTGCTLCVKVCPYQAIACQVGQVAVFNTAACMGCGACAAECPPDAIVMPGFTDEQLLAQIDAATEEHPEEKVIVFACNWCSYAGADQAGISRWQYPPSSRVIRTMCSARVSQDLVMRAFERGAAAVAVTGCHLTDCHYINANHATAKRLPRWQKRLAHRGVEPERLGLEWVSAAEGRRFADFMAHMDGIAARYRSRNGAQGDEPRGTAGGQREAAPQREAAGDA